MKFLPIIILTILSFTATTAERANTLRKAKHIARETNERSLQGEKTNLWESRIVGGTVADVDEYPFYVNWGGQCGASLIAREWIMTAAHCDPISTDFVRINRSRGVGYEVGRGDFAKIIDRFPHPNYNGNTHDSDIMLMRLEEPVLNYDPIPLNFNENVPENGEDLKVIGFGRLESGGSSPKELQEVVVQYVDTDTCNQDESYNGDITDAMFCAGVSGGGKDSCQGDSGGPMFTFDNDGGSTQVGVVSWGRGCARPNKPGVYARVSAFEGWIKDLICSDEEHHTEYKPDFCSDGDSNPSPEDTRPPNPAPTDNDDSEDSDSSVQLHLEMTYDEFPDEVSWEIIQNGQVVASGKGNSDEVEKTVSYTYDVDEGYTEFHLKDSAEDGICCSHGYGGYKLSVEVNGISQKVAESDGEFDSVETTSFNISGSSTDDEATTPLPAQNDSTAQLRLEMTYDEFPEEVRWEIIQNGQIVARGSGNSDEKDETISYRYDVEEGYTEFLVEDFADDGICCSHGYGGYGLYIDFDDGISRKVAESDGTFSSVELKTFHV